ncbi:MAG: hypothetical protein ICV73_25185 [Acetobacteraceae bacterium]|nr:hypothetical protein [Acetobacteraceae bacterium]
MLHMLSVLTAVLTGAILAHLGLEGLLLREPPRRARGQRPSPVAREEIAPSTQEAAS